ncbi:hypothetical protein FB446DRAFT_648840 [Lentinula raphanica]|nr:hypothetical protein FB446DRAFT_648840 [Lentinula raphanica]
MIYLTILTFKPRKNGAEKLIVNEVTTLCRHIESCHALAYRLWCNKTQFTSMLPKDVSAGKASIKEAAEKQKQSMLDAHLEQKPGIKYTVPYLSTLFREAAVEWLVRTDQPIDALEHPSFHHMVEITSRAPSAGVEIPNQKATRAYIITQFKKSLTDLSERLNVHFI